MVLHVVTTGGSRIKATKIVEAAYEVIGVVAVYNRLSGSGQAVERTAGAPFRALRTFDEVCAQSATTAEAAC